MYFYIYVRVFLDAVASLLHLTATIALTCLGREHAERAFMDGARACPCWHCCRISFTEARLPSAVSKPAAASHLVNTLGDLRVSVGALPPVQPLQTSHSSSMPCAVELQSDCAGPSRGATFVSFSAG